jgi:hypothetical protein
MAIETSWRTRMSVQDWINLACGVVLIIFPWGLGFSRDIGASITAWAGGFVIAVMALSALVWFAEWEDWIALIAGILMIVLPWEIGYAINAQIWAFTGLGAIVIISSLSEIWMVRHHQVATAS